MEIKFTCIKCGKVKPDSENSFKQSNRSICNHCYVMSVTHEQLINKVNMIDQDDY